MVRPDPSGLREIASAGPTGPCTAPVNDPAAPAGRVGRAVPGEVGARDDPTVRRALRPRHRPGLQRCPDLRTAWIGAPGRCLRRADRRAGPPGVAAARRRCRRARSGPQARPGRGLPRVPRPGRPRPPRGRPRPPPHRGPAQRRDRGHWPAHTATTSHLPPTIERPEQTSGTCTRSPQPSRAPSPSTTCGSRPRTGPPPHSNELNARLAEVRPREAAEEPEAAQHRANELHRRHAEVAHRGCGRGRHLDTRTRSSPHPGRTDPDVRRPSR